MTDSDGLTILIAICGIILIISIVFIPVIGPTVIFILSFIIIVFKISKSLIESIKKLKKQTKKWKKKKKKKFIKEQDQKLNKAKKSESLKVFKIDNKMNKSYKNQLRKNDNLDQNFSKFKEAEFLSILNLVENKTDNSILQSYLTDIYRIPLLSESEENSLETKIKNLIEIEILKNKSGKQRDKSSITDISNNLNLSSSEIKKRIREGKRARERLASVNLRLVVNIAKKYCENDEKLLSLIEVGAIFLGKAAEKFDPREGYRFSDFAYWWVTQGITNELNAGSNINSLFIKLKKGINNFIQEMDRKPNFDELVNYLDLTKNDLENLILQKQMVSVEYDFKSADDFFDKNLLIKYLISSDEEFNIM